MNGWLLSIIGIIFLGVMIDILYPHGKTNAFCKSIFGVFSMFILISPILNLDVKKLENSSNDYISEQLLMSLESSKENVYKLKIESLLKSNEIEGVNVEIQGNSEDNGFIIENIYLDVSEIVLTKNLTNINKYKVITNIILESVEIDPERIIIYG